MRVCFIMGGGVLLEKEKVNQSISVDGAVEVKKGKIIVHPAKGEGDKPSILPIKEVDIYIDGSRLTKRTILKGNEDITWKRRKTKQHWFTIEVSEDKLSVYLTINDAIHKQSVIRDCKPTLNYKPELIEVKKTYDINEYSSMITEHLMKMGIKAEVKASVILEELSNPTYEKILISKGIAPTESKDGYVELMFSNEVEQVVHDEKSRIDFRNRFKIPSVKEGDLIGKIHPPIKGENGTNVYGQPIYSKPAKSIDVRANRKVSVTESGEIIARETGRPSMTGNLVKYFDIVDTYDVRGDVDLKSGHVYFSGDVVVNGDVKEEMRVEALGNVYINGNVYNGTVISAQNIFVNGTIIRSEIVSGQHGLFFSEVYKVINKIYLTVKDLSKALNQMTRILKEQGKDYYFGHLVANLVETKYKDLVTDYEKLKKILAEMQSSEIEIPIQLRVASQVLNVFSKHHLMLTINKPMMIRSVLFALKEVVNQSEASVKEEGDITINDANMSTIKTNGSIYVKKAGVIQSVLFAGKDCIFEDETSVIRGGKVEAMGKVIAGVVGSDLGARPSVYAGESIRMKKLIKATIRVNHLTTKVKGPVYDVSFRYNEKDNEIVSYPPVVMER